MRWLRSELSAFSFIGNAPVQTFFTLCFALSFASLLHIPYEGSFIRFFPTLIHSAGLGFLDADPFIQANSRATIKENFIFISIYNTLFHSILDPLSFYYYLGFFQIFCFVLVVFGGLLLFFKSIIFAFFSTAIIVAQPYYDFHAGYWFSFKREFSADQFCFLLILCSYHLFSVRKYFWFTIVAIVAALCHLPLFLSALGVFLFTQLLMLSGSTISKRTLLLSLISSLLSSFLLLYLGDYLFLGDLPPKQFYKIFVETRHPHHYALEISKVLIFCSVTMIILGISFWYKLLSDQAIFLGVSLVLASILFWLWGQVFHNKLIYVFWPLRLLSMVAPFYLAVVIGRGVELLLKRLVSIIPGILQVTFAIVFGVTLLFVSKANQELNCHRWNIFPQVCVSKIPTHRYPDLVNFINGFRDNKAVYLVTNLAYFRVLGLPVHGGSVFWFNDPAGWARNVRAIESASTIDDLEKLVPSSWLGKVLAITTVSKGKTDPIYQGNGFFVYMVR